jgi:hypothetical protein
VREAVHGAWCRVRVWPTQCPSCGTRVFFLTCDHGSKVFFDELGPPWPVHDCDTSWTSNLKRTIDKTGRITVELRPGITVTRLPDSFELDASVIANARTSATKRVPDPIVVVEPADSALRTVVGILREIARSSDPLDTYRLDDTTIGRALLGPIGTGAVGRITVHAPSMSDGQLDSFTAWVPAELLEDQRITRGLTVSIAVEGVAIPGRDWAWYCVCFEVVG